MTTNTPITSSAYVDMNNNKDAGEMDADMSTSPSTTIAIRRMPPNTLKTDVRFVFQPFGEVKRIFMQPGGHHASVMFADVKGVRCALHAYAERPLRVRGHEILVFRQRNHVRLAGIGVGKGGGSGVASQGHYYMRHEQDDGERALDDALFVANFPAGTTQEELAEIFRPHGKYKPSVMRTSSFSS
jgi:RNA recognition motif-containing protein